MNAAEKGMLNGMTMDTDGNPLPLTLEGLKPSTMHTGHPDKDAVASKGKIIPNT